MHIYLYLFDKILINIHISSFFLNVRIKVDGRYYMLFIVYVANEENIKQLSKTLTFS